jgi:hypothetical protein
MCDEDLFCFLILFYGSGGVGDEPECTRDGSHGL